MPYAALVGGAAESPPDARTLAASLTPHLAAQCADRYHGQLGAVEWFKTDWQRGGAATGWASWRQDGGDSGSRRADAIGHDDDSDGERRVVVKLPVVPRELTWLQRLQGHDVVPRVYAGDTALNGYDLAWVVMEHLPHGPLGQHWEDEHVVRCADAIARFHAAGAQHPVTAGGRIEEWDDLVRRGTDAVRTSRPPHAAAWTDALKGLSRRLDGLVTEWRARPINTWLHGDAHLANAMARSDDPAAPVCLIDLAEVRAGHWVEDAVYFERQLWAHPERVKATRPVRAVTRARKALGLETGPDAPRLAMIRRVLLAGTAPAFLRSEGHPAHLDACLQWLETGLNAVK